MDPGKESVGSDQTDGGLGTNDSPEKPSLAGRDADGTCQSWWLRKPYLKRIELSVQVGTLVFVMAYTVTTCHLYSRTVDSFEAVDLHNRPWVVLDEFVFDEKIEHSVKATIKNVGGGPAFDIEFALECTAVENDADEASLDAAGKDAIERAQKRPLWWPSLGQSDYRAGYVVHSNLDILEKTELLPSCFGRIIYRGADQSRYESRFARQYNPIPRRVRGQAGSGGLGDGTSWMSSSFDASEFMPIGGPRLNYSR